MSELVSITLTIQGLWSNLPAAGCTLKISTKLCRNWCRSHRLSKGCGLTFRLRGADLKSALSYVGIGVDHIDSHRLAVFGNDLLHGFPMGLHVGHQLKLGAATNQIMLRVLGFKIGIPVQIIG